MANQTQIFVGVGVTGFIAFLAFRAFAGNRSEDTETVKERVLKWEPLVRRYAPPRGLPVSLVLGQIWVESQGKKDAAGKAGEVGLMQIKPIAAREVGDSEPAWTASGNIDQGTRFLEKIHKLTGNTYDTLRAYNRRGTNVAALTATEGSAYANKVLAKAKIIAAELNEPSLKIKLSTAASMGTSAPAAISKTIFEETKEFFQGLF